MRFLVQNKYDANTSASDCAGWERWKNLQQTQVTATIGAGHKLMLPYLPCEEHTPRVSISKYSDHVPSYPPAAVPAVKAILWHSLRQNVACRDYCSMLLCQLRILDPTHQGFVPVTSSAYAHCCITEVLLAPNISPSTLDWRFWWIRKVFQFFTDIRTKAQLNSAKLIWNCIWFCGEELMVSYSPKILLLTSLCCICVILSSILKLSYFNSRLETTAANFLS